MLSVFLPVVRGWYKQQDNGKRNARWGMVMYAQRFGSALNPNPHFHALALDGVYCDVDGEPTFHAAPSLVDESPILAGMTAASVQGLVATGDRAGVRVRRVLSDPPEAVRTGASSS